MTTLPFIDAPDQEVVLDLSKIESANYAESEIQVIVKSSKTTVVLPQAKNIIGYPTFYFLFLDKGKVRVQSGDVFFKGGVIDGFTEYENTGGNPIVVIKKTVVVPESFHVPVSGIFIIQFP